MKISWQRIFFFSILVIAGILLVTLTINNFAEHTIRWSALYFGCLFGSAFFSAMAALFLKLEILSEQPKCMYLHLLN